MKISDAGLDLIRGFEGCRLEAYPDPGTGGEPWTIGVGHTGGVRPGQTITQDEADALLRSDLERFEKCVDGCVRGAITQQQFDALVSFAFNLGCNALRGSTLLHKLNQGDDAGAGQEFLKWDKAGGRVMAGLTRRRQAEMDLFLS